MNLYVLALVAAMSFAGAWRIQDWRHDSASLKQVVKAEAKKEERAATVDAAATSHEKDKVQIRTVTRTIVKEVDRVVKEDHFYAVDSPSCFDDAGLRLIQQAAAGSAPVASQPASAVRRP
jgi:hypothetical protein